jgi:hypothetical protein
VAQQGCGGSQQSAPLAQQSASVVAATQHACGGSQQSAPAAQQSALAAVVVQQAGQHGQQAPSQPAQPMSQQEQPQQSAAGAGRLAVAFVPATINTRARPALPKSFTSISPSNEEKRNQGKGRTPTHAGRARTVMVRAGAQCP